jgi:HSP20 family molecular chaperone IbpA
MQPNISNSIINDLLVNNIFYLSLHEAKFIDCGDRYSCNLEIPKNMIKYVKIFESNNKIYVTIDHTSTLSSFKVDEYKNEINNKITMCSIEKIERTFNLPNNSIKNSISAKYVAGKIDIHILKSSS